MATDGAPGMIRAVEECFPSSLRQRCLAHRMRNLQAKVPDADWADFREAAKAAYHAPSPAMARALAEDLEARFGKVHPTAVRCFRDDFEPCIAHLLGLLVAGAVDWSFLRGLRCPPAHRRVIPATNLLERLFGEARRRLNAAKTMFGERAVLKLMYASAARLRPVAWNHRHRARAATARDLAGPDRSGPCCRQCASRRSEGETQVTPLPNFQQESDSTA